MLVEIAIWFGTTAVVTAVGAFLGFVWGLIITFIRETLYAWMVNDIPALAGLVKEAYIQLDRVAVPVIAAAKRAWLELRKWLLKQTIEVLELEKGKFSYRLVSWVLQPNAEEKVRKVIMDEAVPWEELPSDIREQLIRRGKVEEIDVVKTRDEEFEKLTA